MNIKEDNWSSLLLDWFDAHGRASVTTLGPAIFMTPFRKYRQNMAAAYRIRRRKYGL